MHRPVEERPDFPALEQRWLGFWQEQRVFDKLREKNKGKPKWRFLDGPITANNPMGVHHAWGRSLKDMFQRYHAMCGCELRYQNGFDCQGLWVEVEVEKELGFKSKADIETYGVERFVEACKARVRKYSAVQAEQSVRLGYWMDWSDSYFTMSDENNYTIWSFLKKCHDRGFIYKGVDVMPWCPRCGVGLSQMEMHEGYRWLGDLSVVVRLPLRERRNEALLVWTTTPWTLTCNVGVAVNPRMQYVKVRQGEWTYYIGKENWQSKRSVETEETSPKGKTRRTVGLTPFPAMLKSLGECEVVGEVLGSEMLGWAYDGPFDELPAQREMGGFPWPDPKLRSRCGASDHRVIAWDLVSGAEGTGLVHIAPGCGKEDYALGQSKGLVALAPLNEHGVFLPAFGPFAGSYAHDVGEAIAADLKRKGLLVAKEHYPHRYPHCWRCGTKTLFRLVDEWYIRMGWRQEIMYLVPQIRWIPDWGEKQELDWLSNMGDWMISKKRFWGLALPIWQCDRHSAPGAERCSWFDVIGSRDELRSRAAEGWAEFDGHSPHRPWVDKVKVRCPKCGGTASRIPDVGNPWLDAGIVPFSTQRYHADRAYWDQWYPADLVLECFPGQFRNWFYALLAMSTMMQEDRWADRNGGVSKVVPPFKALLGHALVRDEEGKEMHKSAGNAIEFNEAAASMGAEVMRYIFAAQNPENNLNFPDIRKDRRKDVLHLDQQVQRRLNSLWNCYSFYVLYASVDKIQPASLRASSPERSELDRWILSKLQGLIACARKSFEERRIYLFMGRFERFVDALSNWYLRRSRRRFWKSEADADKLAAYATLYECLETLVRLLSPVLPFLAEEIYQNLVRAVCPQAPGSVHLLAYPEADASRVDERLEKRIDAVVRYRDLALSIRSAANVKVRQPLARMLVRPESAEERDALSDASLRGQLLEEVNVRTLELLESAEGLVRARLKPDPKRLGERYGRWLKEIEEHLAATDAAAVQANLRVTGCYRFEAGPQTVELLADDVVVEHEAPAGIRFVFDGEAFAALDTELTPELKAEGTARDVVRGIQDLRKSIGLHVADRIRIRYRTDAETAVIIKDWAEYIRKETLALELLCDDSIAEGSVKLKAARSPIHVKLERCG